MKDLTIGKPGAVIIQFALPILFGHIFQLFYNIADTYIIGDLLGDQALAAVGCVSPISDLIVGFLIGLTNGFSVIAARFFGAKDEQGLNKAFGGSLLYGTLTALVLTFVSVCFLPGLLQLVNVPVSQLADSTSYIRIILLGMIASMLYNICASILRAIGDTKAPLLFLIISVLINVLLDYLLVGFASMGISGASIATVISQMLSALLCFLYIYRKYPVFHLSRKSFILTSDLSGQLWSSGLSMGFMSSLVTLGTLMLQGAINTFSSATIIAHYAARKLTTLFMTPGSFLGMTMASYCSQNYGAGKKDRIKKGILKAVLYSAIWDFVVIMVVYTFVPVMIQWITATNNPEVIQTATLYLRINCILYIVTSVISIARNALQGIGDHVTPIISSSIELLGKFLTVVFLAPALAYMGIIISEPLVWCVMVIPLLIQLKRKV